MDLLLSSRWPKINCSAETTTKFRPISVNSACEGNAVLIRTLVKLIGGFAQTKYYDAALTHKSFLHRKKVLISYIYFSSRQSYPLAEFGTI